MWFGAVSFGSGRERMDVLHVLPFAGPATTYSPVSWDTVPSALRSLTAEFGMGSGLVLLAPVTGPAKGRDASEGCLVVGLWRCVSCRVFRSPLCAGIMGDDRADRAISTGKLNALLRLHARPIDVVVYHGSRGRSRFEVGFPLRCFQRLSRPYIATLHRGWRHDRSTRGTSIPVLSY